MARQESHRILVVDDAGCRGSITLEKRRDDVDATTIMFGRIPNAMMLPERRAPPATPVKCVDDLFLVSRTPIACYRVQMMTWICLDIMRSRPPSWLGKGRRRDARDAVSTEFTEVG